MKKIITPLLLGCFFLYAHFIVGQNVAPVIGAVNAIAIAEGSNSSTIVTATDADNQEVIPIPRIVIIGSSTAAGAGVWNTPGVITPDAWVERLRVYLGNLGITYRLANLARSGISTINVMPTLPTSDPNYRNSLAYAFSPQFNTDNGFTPNLVIVNLPSNDATLTGWDPAVTLANYRTMRQFVESKGAKFVLLTPQPRSHFDDRPPFSPARRRLLQRDQTEAIMREYGDLAVPVFYELANLNDYTIKAAYSAGDGVHLNRLGHQFIFDRACEGIRPFVEGKQKISFTLSPPLRFAKLTALGQGRASLQLSPKFNDGGRFNADSTYEVMLEANDNHGGRSSVRFNIQVTHINPGSGMFAGAQELRSFTRPGGGTVNYYIYYPQNYDESATARLPMLVSLHGSEGFGDSPAGLLTGINSMVGSPVRQANENKAFPMIVVSPQQSNGQTPNAGRWNPVLLNELVNHCTTNFKVDNTRVYFTGYEWGGHGVWNYCQQFPNAVAAAGVVGGISSGLLSGACAIRQIPFRTWHSASDAGSTLPAESIAKVNAINGCTPPPPFPAELTLISAAQNLNNRQTVAMVYADVTGPNNLYSWLNRYKKSGTNTTTNSANFPQTNWNGNSWTNGRPNAGVNAVMGSTYPNGVVGEGSFTCLDLSFDYEAITNIGDGHAVEVHGTLKLGELGNVVVASNGSLIQKPGSTLEVAGTNPGLVRVNKNGRVARAYNQWSSPVVNFNLDSLRLDASPAWRYHYVEGAGWQPASGMMLPGKGYLAVRMRYQSFVGVPNNGEIVVSGIGYTAGFPTAGYHLVGNPYPSALDIARFMADNENLSGTTWVWNDNNGGAGGGNYETLTALSPLPMQASGQGFFVRRLQASPITSIMFNNGQRSRNAPSFLRAENQLERFKLKVGRQDGLSDHLLLGFADGFTAGVDRTYDGAKHDGNPQISFAAFHNGGRYAHTALPVSTERLALPLHLNVARAGQYSFMAEEVLGQTERPIFLEDAQTGEWYHLKLGRSHTLHLQAGNYRDRFYLRMASEVVGRTNSDAADLYSYGSEVFVTQDRPGPVEVQVYHLSGKLMAHQKQATASAQAKFNFQLTDQGLYVVKLITSQGVLTKRLWIGSPE